MRILEWQFNSMLQADETGWLRFVCSSLQDSYPMSPVFDLGEQARLVTIADICDRARANDLRTDAELLAFVFLMHEIAPDFDQHPYIRALLDVADKPIAERWERLFDQKDNTLERTYNEIGENWERHGRIFDIDQYDRIEEAFPTTYRDPRFVQCFREIKARNKTFRERIGI